MLLIVLLLVALLCIVLGVVLASGPWFIASLAASALAGYLLWRRRTGGGRAPGMQPAAARAPRQTALVTGTAFAGKVEPDAAAGRPAAAGGEAGHSEVWVVDGRPAYHRQECTGLAGARSEPVPRIQAVEDGFTPCAVCRPDHAAGSAARDAAGAADADAADAADAVDGPGRTPAPAVEGSGRTPAPAADPVWVVDGRPRYHRRGCLVLDGQDAEAIPLLQATEDGFIPCSMCAPQATPA